MKLVIRLIGKMLYFIICGTLSVVALLLYTPIAIIKACNGKHAFKNTRVKRKATAIQKETVAVEDSTTWVDQIEEIDALLED